MYMRLSIEYTIEQQRQQQQNIEVRRTESLIKVKNELNSKKNKHILRFIAVWL